MGNWENRARKVSTRRQNKAMTKPFKKKYDLQNEHKKRTKIQIKQAQKERKSHIEDMDEEDDFNN